jgi:hypothetical protein
MIKHLIGDLLDWLFFGDEDERRHQATFSAR